MIDVRTPPSAVETGMWKLEIESFVVDFGPPSGKIPGRREFMTNKEKATKILRLGGGGTAGPERYIYKDRDVSFEFWASRVDIHGKTLNRYEVELGPALPKGLTLERGQEIATNIREALLAWPPDRTFYRDSGRVGEIWFEMTHWDQYKPEMRERFP